jgi:hypothetical protein
MSGGFQKCPSRVEDLVQAHHTLKTKAQLGHLRGREEEHQLIKNTRG